MRFTSHLTAPANDRCSHEQMLGTDELHAKERRGQFDKKLRVNFFI